jgi:hypothetical protein
VLSTGCDKCSLQEKRLVTTTLVPANGVYKGYMRSQKILISLPSKLVTAIDAVKNERHISRSAFVRESLLRNLHYYEKYERGRVGTQLDDPEFSCGGTL